MRQSYFYYICILVISINVTFTSSVEASIVLNNTRVIYKEQEGETTIKLSNVGKKPLLVQSWIDNGDVMKDPSLIKLPFILMPPLSRVNSGKGQTLRLIYTGGGLPLDRESVFYLNVLEIPPKAESSTDKNIMQIALRTRVKIFFRPTNIKGDALDAHRNLTWKLVKRQGKWVLKCENMTPYHVSMSEISLLSNTESYSVGSGMVAPYSNMEVNIDVSPDAIDSVVYKVVNDYGAIKKYSSGLAYK